MTTIARANIVTNFNDDSDSWIIHNVPVDAWYVTEDDGGGMPVLSSPEGICVSFIDGGYSCSIVLGKETIEAMLVELTAGKKRFEDSMLGNNE